MTTEPGRDYPIGATFQPDEPPLQMGPDRLTAVRDAARSVADEPGVHAFDDFIIYNGRCRLARARLIGRGLCRKVLPGRRERPGHAA
jgi:hydroxyacylglutathione hydrolase